MTRASKPVYFATPDKLRAWFEKNHAKADELIVGFYKKSSGKPSITWPQAVDEALCFGWIDGIRRSIDDERYTNRFTPRRARSNWSAVNVKRVCELTREGRMTPAGRKAFEARKEFDGYSYEQRNAAAFAPAETRRFKADKKAWAWFQKSAPSYRKAATWWVMSAKKPETRESRLDKLIASSRRGATVPPLTAPAKREKL